MRKVVGVLLIIGLIATVCAFFTHSAHYGKKNNPIDFRPVYLSNVSLNARFSNDGPEILVVQYSDIEKAPINLSKPVLVVGEINVTRLLITFNITTPLASIEPSPKAVFVYNRGLLFLESGDVRKFLVWTREVIRYDAHWSFGIYSEHSGILLAVRSSHVEPPKNWSSVGGTLPEYLVSVEITVPGNENVELSLVPLNGKLSNYHPTTSKGPDFTIHDRSSFFRNTAAWTVENNGDHDVQLSATIGAESPQLTLQYFLNDVEGSLHVRMGP